MASAVSRVQYGRCVGKLHLQSDDFEGEGDEADSLVTYSSPTAYKSMAQDRRRNRAYEHAIAAAMKNEKLRSWLEIGPGADILLTKYFIAAARANSRSSRRLKPLEYVGIEGNKTSFKKAEKELARFLQGSHQPFSYRLFHGHSSKDYDNFGSKISNTFDLMFSEIFGDILSSEAFPYLLYKARTDDGLIDKNTQILPPFGATLFLPKEQRCSCRRACWLQPSSLVKFMLGPGWHISRTNRLPCQAISKTVLACLNSSISRTWG